VLVATKEYCSKICFPSEIVLALAVEANYSNQSFVCGHSFIKNGQVVFNDNSS
jgi:hypothetical protein